MIMEQRSYWGIFKICLLFIGIVFLANNIFAVTYYNQSDGFATTTANANPVGLYRNGSDFWVIDANTYFVYHYNSSGKNVTDGFSLPAIGITQSFGVTGNGSDFWFSDSGRSVIVRVNRTGSNLSIINVSQIGIPYALTTNITSRTPTDFWFGAPITNFINHTDSTGGVIANGFKGSGTPYGLTTNNSDFYQIDGSAGTLIHWSRTGLNVNDMPTLSSFGIVSPRGLAISNNSGGAPTDFWIADNINRFIYHLSTNNNTCTATLNVNWIISDTQVCNNQQVAIGTGMIIITSTGKLYLYNSTVSAKTLNMTGTGDKVFINQGSQLRLK